MPNCKDCLHFDGMSARGWGSCDSDEVEKVTDTYDQNGESTCLAVHQNFGCIFFKQDPENPAPTHSTED